MAGYLGMRIIEGAIGYTKAVEAYPQFKKQIDDYLVSKGKENLIIK